MNPYPIAYLEKVLQVDQSREAIARAHAGRMALTDRAARESAKLSDFLPIEQYTKAWFIHDKAEIPICRGWPREAVTAPSHHVESRTCINDALCTDWQPLPEVTSCTAGALVDYLRALQGREPDLRPIGFGDRMVEDADGVQYRFVSMPPLRIPSPADLSKMLYAMAGVA
jgi:hypothetical protein